MLIDEISRELERLDRGELRELVTEELNELDAFMFLVHGDLESVSLMACEEIARILSKHGIRAGGLEADKVEFARLMRKIEKRYMCL